MTTLLIIGAGDEQVPAYKLAKAKGFNVVGTDINPDAPGFNYADNALICSTRDAEQTLRAVMDFCKDYSVDGVMTIANDVPYTVAFIAENLGLPGIDIKSAKLVSDKLLMKQAFKASGVNCPWFSSVSDADHLKQLISEKALSRYVIKPVDGRGARGVLLLDSESDLNWAFNEARRWGDCGRVILEEFTSGIQLSTESFLIDGKAYTPAISERNYEFLERFSPYIIENGGTIPAQLDDHQLEKINELIESGAAALGVSDGIVKGDLILKGDGEPVIVELALRLSGGWFATHQIPAATGVDLVDIAIDFALGEKIDPARLIPKFHKSTAIRYWFPNAGKISSIDGENHLKELEGLIDYGFFRNVGDVQPEVKMHPDRFGYVMVQADTREVALDNVNKGLQMLSVTVQ